MSTNKQYGLILNKKSGSAVSKTNVFNQSDSDDSDDHGSTDWVKKSLQKSAENSTTKRETKIAIQKALQEDCTVYQYDEIYDQMEQKKTDAQKSKEKDRKPKYIEKLLQTSDKRKRENERRIERQVQKEREAEGEQFKDKESFVTSAYKKKLEEFAKLDEEEKRQDMLEEIGDVTKQEDISGFYRHLYQTTVGKKDQLKEEEKKESDKDGKRKLVEAKSKSDGKGKSGENKSSISDVKNKVTEETVLKSKQDDKKSKESRNYRKRKQSESSEGKQDADTSSDSSSSSSSSSSSDSSSDSEQEATQVKDSRERKKSKSPPAKRSKTNKTVESDDNKNITKTEPVISISKDSIDKVESEPKVLKKPDTNIWLKRTVGSVFDAALERYFQRKAAREMSKRKG